MSALATLALVTGLLCALAPLAQAARIARTGSAHDVSLIWLALYAAGSAVWISYGVAIDSLPLIISQSAALVCVAVALFLAARHRREDGQVDQTDVPAAKGASRNPGRGATRPSEHSRAPGPRRLSR